MPLTLHPHFQTSILSATGATSLDVMETIQDLWSGYGRILRIRLEGTSPSTVIAKHIRVVPAGSHPRGWNSSLSHQRKLKSYQVETAWYRDWSHRCGADCRIAALLHFDHHEEETLLLLEDLDSAGYPVRLTSVSPAQLESCLDWLANFHATSMGATPDDLWKTGTYWHLATRSEELAALDDLALKNAAPAIDAALSNARYQTIVHGDAKLANFCFSESGDRVAAVDFQYVGGGCGMKDLAYFIGSCLDEAACEQQESELLDRYFATLPRRQTPEHRPSRRRNRMARPLPHCLDRFPPLPQRLEPRPLEDQLLQRTPLPRSRRVALTTSYHPNTNRLTAITWHMLPARTKRCQIAWLYGSRRQAKKITPSV